MTTNRIPIDMCCEKKISTIDKNTDCLIDYVDISSVDNNEKKIVSFKTIDAKEAPSRARQLINKNDIIVSTVRPNLNAVAVVEKETENLMVASTGYCVLRCKENMDYRYLFNFCQSEYFVNDMSSQATGASYTAVSAGIVRSSLIPYYSLEEQIKITKEIDTVSELIINKKEQIKELDNLVKSRFIELFAKTEKGVLSDVAMITMGQSPDGKTYNDAGEGMPFYQGKTEFGDLYIGNATTWTTAPSRIAVANDVLMSVRAPVGSTNIATEECCIGRGLASIRPIEGKTTTMFILYAMRSIEDEIANMGVGSTFKAINKDQVYKLPIPIADIELQNRFVDIAEQSDKSKFDGIKIINLCKILKIKSWRRES